MAMGRVDRPALMVYGGTIKPGRSRSGDTLDVVSAFQSYGEYVAGNLDEAVGRDRRRGSAGHGTGPGSIALNAGNTSPANLSSCARRSSGGMIGASTK